MKTKENTAENFVKVPESALLSLVARDIKGRVLFPEKLQKAKAYVKKMQSGKR